MLLKAVITFLLTTGIWLIFMSFIDYIMDIIIDNVDTYYPTNLNLFVMVASFITIFGIVAFGIRVLAKKEAVF